MTNIIPMAEINGEEDALKQRLLMVEREIQLSCYKDALRDLSYALHLFEKYGYKSTK